MNDDGRSTTMQWRWRWNRVGGCVSHARNALRSNCRARWGRRQKASTSGGKHARMGGRTSRNSPGHGFQVLKRGKVGMKGELYKAAAGRRSRKLRGGCSIFFSATPRLSQLAANYQDELLAKEQFDHRRYRRPVEFLAVLSNYKVNFHSHPSPHLHTCPPWAPPRTTRSLPPTTFS